MKFMLSAMQAISAPEKGKWKVLFWFCSSLAVVFLSPASITGQNREGGKDGKSIADGLYSQAQAERGGAIFAGQCASCHEDPHFTDPTIDRYEGDSVANLVSAIRLTMPEDSPGSLPLKEYVDVVTYLFKTRGVPVGEVEMPADMDKLKQIRIVLPHAK